MSKKKRSQEGGGNWMDTYGDLVTLLLTFFVMLYSMSTLDAKKWEIFVRSIGNDSAVKAQEEVSVNSSVGEDTEELMGTPEIPEIEMPMDEETLYLTLLEKLNEIGVEGISVTRGEDYTFIVFQDSPFFDGDSSVLTEQGKEVLDVFCQVLDGATDVVGQINIMGHTAQALPDRPNRVRTDRMLSSMRAAEVCIYIQEKNIIEPEKLICLSYGQHRPVATFETAEGRALNRRVELLLLDNDADLDKMNEDYSEYSASMNFEQLDEIGDETAASEEGFETAEPNQENVSTRMSPVQEVRQEVIEQHRTGSGAGEAPVQPETAQIGTGEEMPAQPEAAQPGAQGQTPAQTGTAQPGVQGETPAQGGVPSDAGTENIAE